MTTNEIVDDFQMSFKTRKFAAGLPLAFIDYLVELGVLDHGWLSFDDFVCALQEQDSYDVQKAGKHPHNRPG